MIYDFSHLILRWPQSVGLSGTRGMGNQSPREISHNLTHWGLANPYDVMTLDPKWLLPTSQNTSNSTVCSTPCSSQQQNYIKAPYYRTFVWGIHRLPLDSTTKGQFSPVTTGFRHKVSIVRKRSQCHDVIIEYLRRFIWIFSYVYCCRAPGGVPSQHLQFYFPFWLNVVCLPLA